VKIRFSVLCFALAHLILTAFRRLGRLASEPFELIVFSNRAADLATSLEQWAAVGSTTSVQAGGEASGLGSENLQLDTRQIPFSVGESGNKHNRAILGGMRGTVADLGENLSHVLLRRLHAVRILLPFTCHNTKPTIQRGQFVNRDIQHTNGAQRTASMFAQIKSVESSAMNNLQFKVTCDRSMTGVPFSFVPSLSHLQFRFLSDVMS